MTYDNNPAATVRNALKSELGLNSKAVSVRQDRGRSVYVTIKVPGVSLQRVTAIAERSESISRCAHSGDILGGGNTFVFVNYASGLFAAQRAELTETFGALAYGHGHQVTASIYVYREDREVFGVMVEGEPTARAYGADGAARLAAFAVNEEVAAALLAPGALVA